ncbi:MAG: hypothetical protein K9K84_04210 [Methylovulum sp.]|jgi:tetratricopeptide (TPR) repeat protein|nr:hypothetical protein [Methylovulum sp.]
MSLLNLFNKRAGQLKTAIKQSQEARNKPSHSADNLYKAAYQGYAEVMMDDPMRADTLYHWGFALLHQARSKTGTEAEKMYSEAIEKFSFCRVINPHYLGAAIDGGVAYMELARLKKVVVNDKLYDLAKQCFDRANSIQKGTASYNLACIHALKGDELTCLSALQDSFQHGSLPVVADIKADLDLANVVNILWFTDFIAMVDAQEQAQAAALEAARLAKLKAKSSAKHEDDEHADNTGDNLAEKLTEETAEVAHTDGRSSTENNESNTQDDINERL